MRNKSLFNRIQSTLWNQTGESYVDTGVKILLGIVIGALLLTGIYSITQNVVLDSVETKFEEFFDKTPTLNGGNGSGGTGGSGNNGNVEETITVLLGDANGDEAVNVTDATTISRTVENLAGNICDTNIKLFAADVNQDGVINDSDADIVSKYTNRTFKEEILAQYPNIGTYITVNASNVPVVEYAVATYSYNGTELSDINSVWTDKEAYPYACIYINGTDTVLAVAPDLFYVAINYSQGIDVIAAYDYLNNGSLPTWIYSNGKWIASPVERYFDNGDETLSSLIWVNANVVDVCTDTLYASASDPVLVS